MSSDQRRAGVSEQTLTQYAQRISHDLKGPLRRIGVFARVLAEEEMSNLTADGQEAVRFIEVSARQAKSRLVGVERLTQCLLLQLSPVAVTDARAILTTALAAVGHPNTRIEGDIPPGLRTDPQLLGRLLDELLRNAEQWGGGVDHIGNRVSATAWEITVHDSGAGIEAEDRARAFAPFETLGRNGGTGVGLSIAEVLAQRLGGDVLLAGSASGGLAARVSIPLTDGSAPDS